MSERYQVRKVGKDWKVFDVNDPETTVQMFRSRRGFPADSLAFRARLRADYLNKVDRGEVKMVEFGNRS